ncbi:uncharacterized protein VTP21DRAFT_9854 [Calcarisporiella thermophila]|uniref:uncharacterized protein n=1 Tax=Calcarisporiella thermophila TaxID=911321 RepID=UPI003743CFDE
MSVDYVEDQLEQGSTEENPTPFTSSACSTDLTESIRDKIESVMRKESQRRYDQLMLRLEADRHSQSQKLRDMIREFEQAVARYQLASEREDRRRKAEEIETSFKPITALDNNSSPLTLLSPAESVNTPHESPNRTKASNIDPACEGRDDDRTVEYSEEIKEDGDGLDNKLPRAFESLPLTTLADKSPHSAPGTAPSTKTSIALTKASPASEELQSLYQQCLRHKRQCELAQSLLRRTHEKLEFARRTSVRAQRSFDDLEHELTLISSDFEKAQQKALEVFFEGVGEGKGMGVFREYLNLQEGKETGAESRKRKRQGGGEDEIESTLVKEVRAAKRARNVSMGVALAAVIPLLVKGGMHVLEELLKRRV